MRQPRPGAGRVDPPSIIDRSIKALARRAPATFLQLAGVAVKPEEIRVTDVEVNLPEFRADQVFLVGAEDDPARWAAHLEYQLQPDARKLRGWFLKNAALTAQLDMDVLLVALYLSRGRRRTFPASYVARAGGLRNEFLFEKIHLWEHADRIRRGELPELAPLLVLCEDKPSEQTLRREREIIIGASVPDRLRSDLLAVAFTVGTRYFARDLVEVLFRQELMMLKGASWIEEWIAEGEERGEAKGRTEGRTEGIRRTLLLLLRERFGELAPTVVNRVENADPEWCEQTAIRLLNARSLAELGL